MPVALWWARPYLIRSGCCRVSAWNSLLNIPANFRRENTGRFARSSLKARRRPRKRLLKCRRLKLPKLKFLKNETLLEPCPVGHRLLPGGTGTDSAFRGLSEDRAVFGGRRHCGLLTRYEYC